MCFSQCKRVVPACFSGTKNPDRKRSGGTQFSLGGLDGQAAGYDIAPNSAGIMEELPLQWPLNSFLIIVQGITSYSLFGQSEV